MGGSVAGLIVSVTWTETALGSFFYLLRVVSNWQFTGRFRWDFTIATATVITQLIAQVFLQLSVNDGMGQHLDALDGGQIVSALRLGWVYQLLAIAASTMGKLAILALLIQIRGTRDKKPWGLIILGILIGAVNIAVMGTILGQCKPMAKLWDDGLEGTCDPGRKLNQNYSFFQASFNSFCDALLASYPAYLVWNLQMKRRVKIGLSILMGLGWIAAACSAVKCYELEALTKTEDITYALHQLLIWASTESWIVIIVGCVPPCRPIMERALQLIGLTSTKKTSTTPYSGGTPGGYAQFGGDRSTHHSNVRSNAFRSRAGSFGQEEGHTWVELATTGGPNSSKEQIIHGTKDVVVTTDITTHFEEARPRGAASSNDSRTSGDDLARDEPEVRKVV